MTSTVGTQTDDVQAWLEPGALEKCRQGLFANEAEAVPVSSSRFHTIYALQIPHISQLSLHYRDSHSSSCTSTEYNTALQD